MLIYFDLLHRLLGVASAGVVGLPLLFFTFKGWLKAPMLLRVGGMLGLGAYVGANGYLMRSLYNSEKEEDKKKLKYFKFMHTSASYLTYSTFFWNALTLLRTPQEYRVVPEVF
jgi:hypothetical protein